MGEPWILHVNGASNTGGSQAEMILANPERVIIEQALRFNFKTSNNKVEYETLLIGLRLTRKLKAQHLQAFSNFQLIVGQICREFDTKALTMKKYLQ